MYCHHCGKKRTDDAIYCSQCGRRLAAEAAVILPPGAEELAAGREELAAAAPIELVDGQLIIRKAERRTAEKGSIWTWLVPLLLALLTTAAVVGYYCYQLSINDRVSKLHTQAQSAALSGDYAAAQSALKEAARTRPEFAAVDADLEIVNHAAELERSLTAVKQKLEEQKLEEAEQILKQTKESLKGHAEPIYTRVRGQMELMEERLDVMRISSELDSLKTVSELEKKFNIVKAMDSEEAAAIKLQILERIMETSYSNAEELLQKKSYTEALDVTSRALAFDPDNEKLINLEEQIYQAQKNYVKAEQQRLEQAMQKAAEEDLRNQTAAVEVVGIESVLDEFGDLNIEGELRNAATRPIYSISIQYAVYDAEGKKLGAGTAVVEPDYVEPGETMSFNGTVYGVYVENTSVVVEHATWYLD